MTLTYTQCVLLTFGKTYSRLPTQIYTALRQSGICRKPKTHRGCRGGSKAWKPNIIDNTQPYIGLSSQTVESVSASRQIQDWRIVPTAGDGHCLIHSVRGSWGTQVPNKPPLTNNTICSCIFTESVTNVDLYIPYFEGGRIPTFLHGLSTYLLQKQYNQTFGDVVPSIIANALNIHLQIINQNNDGSVQNIDIIPDPRHGSSPPDHVTIHRKSDHYSAVEYIPAIEHSTLSAENLLSSAASKEIYSGFDLNESLGDGVPHCGSDPHVSLDEVPLSAAAPHSGSGFDLNESLGDGVPLCGSDPHVSHCHQLCQPHIAVRSFSQGIPTVHHINEG